MPIPTELIKTRDKKKIQYQEIFLHSISSKNEFQDLEAKTKVIMSHEILRQSLFSTYLPQNVSQKNKEATIEIAKDNNNPCFLARKLISLYFFRDIIS